MAVKKASDPKRTGSHDAGTNMGKDNNNTNIVDVQVASSNNGDVKSHEDTTN